MFSKFLLNFNTYFIKGVLIMSILASLGIIIFGFYILFTGGNFATLGMLYLTPGFPLLFISILLFYFYRKKRNLIVEGFFIFLWFLLLIWIFYEIISIYSKYHSFKNIDEEAFYFLGFGICFLMLMCVSFFKYRKTLSS